MSPGTGLKTLEARRPRLTPTATIAPTLDRLPRGGRIMNSRGGVTMAVTVRIPSQLRPLAGGRQEIEPPRKARSPRSFQGPRICRPTRASPTVCSTSGKLRRFVDVFLAEEDIRFLEGLDTPVPAGATLSGSSPPRRRLRARAGLVHRLGPGISPVSVALTLRRRLTVSHSRCESANRAPFGPHGGNQQQMPKLIAFDESARRALERGMNQLADAVRVPSARRGERRTREEVGRPHHYQRWRIDRQGNRARGPLREDRGRAGQGSSQED